MKDVFANYDTLVKLLERVQLFLQRLNCYTSIPLTTGMVELLGRIMAQVLSILALSTKTMKERRIRKLIRSVYPFFADYDTETFLKRLVGRTDVEDALQHLDTLTKEEGLMTAARNLQVTHHVDDSVTAIKEVIHDVDSNLRTTTELTYQVADHTKLVETVVRRIDDNLEATKRGTRPHFFTPPPTHLFPTPCQNSDI